MPVRSLLQCRNVQFFQHFLSYFDGILHKLKFTIFLSHEPSVKWIFLKNEPRDLLRGVESRHLWYLGFVASGC